MLEHAAPLPAPKVQPAVVVERPARETAEPAARPVGVSTVAAALTVLRQQDAGAPAPAESPAQRVATALRHAGPVAGVVSDYPGAFHILNGLAMFGILATLEELKGMGYFEDVRDHLGEAHGVNVPRLRVGLRAVDARSSPSAASFTTDNASDLATLPDDQRTDVARYLGIQPAPLQTAPAEPAPQLPPAETSGVPAPVASGDIPVPPSCVAVPVLPESATLCSDVSPDRFGADPAIARFAHDLAVCYADRVADRRGRDEHAAAVRAAEASALRDHFAGETPAQRRERIAAAARAIQAPDRTVVRDAAASERENWLSADYQSTMRAARQRFGADCHVFRISQGWMVARREQVDFQTLMDSVRTTGNRPVAGLGQFGPSSVVEPLVPIERPGTGTPVAPQMNTFLRALSSQAQGGHRRFSAQNYGGHGMGSFHGRGLSIDLRLDERDAPRDERGFYARQAAVEFLMMVDAAAASMNAGWRVLYNDYAVAAEANRRTGKMNVVFAANVDAGGNLNWHGPLVLHFHLDLTPAAPPPRPAEAVP